MKIVRIYLAALAIFLAIFQTTCGGGGGGSSSPGSSSPGTSSPGSGGTPTLSREGIGTPSVSPPIVAAGQATDVTVTAYIPSPNLLPTSVNLLRIDSSGGATVIGLLNDSGRNGDAKAGDQLFTITTSFNESSGQSINLRISATLQGGQEITRDFQVSVLSIPAIRDYTQYNQTVNDIYSKLVDTRNTFLLAEGTTASPAQFSDCSKKIGDNLASVYVSFSAVYRYETHSPSNYPSLLTYLPVFGSLIGKQQQALNEISNFVNNGYDGSDPSLKDIADWSVANCLDDASQLLGDANKGMRQVCAQQYQVHNPSSSFQSARKEAANVIIKEEIGQFTSLAGDAINEIIDGGWLVGQAVDFVIDKIIDTFIPNAGSGQMSLLVGKAANGEIVRVPAGTHNIILSSTINNTRAIAQEISLPAGMTATISLFSGEVKNMSVTAPWPMFGHDPQHTGKSPYPGPAAQPALVWTSGGFVNDNNTQSVLSVDGKTVYGISGYVFRDTISARDIETGSMKYYTVGAAVEVTPAIDGAGVIYFGDQTGKIYALNLDLSLKWSKTGYFGNLNRLHASPAIGPDGNIYMVGSDSLTNNSLLCVKPDGSLKRTYKPSDTHVASLSPAIRSDGTVYIGVVNRGNGEGGLVAVNNDGTLKWRYTFESSEAWKTGISPILTPAIAADGTIYIGTYWNFYAVNKDGTKRWQIATQGKNYSLAVPSVATDGTVYMDLDGGLTAIAPSGWPKWTLASIYHYVISPAETLAVNSNGVIFVASGGDYIYALDPANGHVKWQYSQANANFASPKVGLNGGLLVHQGLDKLSYFK